jgi:hypothetical protein
VNSTTTGTLINIHRKKLQNVSVTFRANSTTFPPLTAHLDFGKCTSMKKSQPLTAFTIPGQGQYQWITSPMGLLGYPASFQHLMEGVLLNISNLIIYIEDLLVHAKTYHDHLYVLDHVLDQLE